MKKLDFTIEFNSDVTGVAAEDEMFVEADNRLRALAEDHDDLTGAAVAVRQPSHGETPPLYEVTVVVYSKPANAAATEKADSPMGALKGALDAAERQVRETRARLRGR